MHRTRDIKREVYGKSVLIEKSKMYWIRLINIKFKVKTNYQDLS